ncbi:p21-C-terminal region-binding protein-domain-containing protein [Leptodontidium sp. 2 PMI_412]|nr:p21-C-terminal region-binding protein-domain-containing protein [Leptodontidium sp. MPI-SDFR-AT-0119]KAH9220211.1 p21-C-terminal region-binding protein-domain-containing protein [Leptodontidium sp. 2 PMI_412]
MVKKRNRDPEVLPEAPPAQGVDNDSGSDDDVDMVNVEFEWFNFKPDVDFHGLKSLLRQLLDVDSQLFDLSALADLILSQPTVGSTVKVDGDETDAYAFLTILNLHEHREKKIIKDLTEYLIEKSKSSPSLAPLGSLLTSSSQVGIVLGERLINVPAEIAPPMYTMLIDEIEAAVEDKEPYEFTHYLILSKTYNEISSSLDQEDAPRTKKNKAAKASREVFYFHPEDEVLQKHALASGSFEYTKDEGEGMADSKRAFSEMGIKPQGSMILIEASKFEGAAKAIGEYLNAAQ